MDTNVRIESGKECSLADLFHGNNKVVIPDLQRDYCWGKDAWIKTEKRFADLVSAFVERLFILYSESSGLGTQTLGLIYGYEQPKGHIQICDGQQRLTTLFLLLGYVNTKAKYVFSDYLMSKEEREDDYEPHLQYAIRESTLYFLSDLTKEVLVEGLSSLESMIKAYRHDPAQKFPAWYFREYDLDASIQNMLAALDSIDHVANEQSFNDWKEFGNYLLNNLQFLYYDMGNRSRGEETYVVINTTGEPLSPAENIKPIVIGSIADDERKKKCSEEWEEREDWFWKNRGNHKTSDAYSYRFLIWYWQIGLLQNKSWKGNVSRELSPRNLFQKQPLSTSFTNGENASVERWELFRTPETIHSYFIAFRQLAEIVANNDAMKGILQSVSLGVLHSDAFSWTLSDFFDRKPDEDKDWRLNVVLPAIAYLQKYHEPKRLLVFLERLRKNFFDLWRGRNPSSEENEKSGSYVDWRHVIQIVEKSETEEAVLTFDTISRRNEFKKGVVLNEWFGQSEKDREELKRHGLDISTLEGHRALMGDLTPLMVIKDDSSIDIEKTNRRWANLKILSTCIENDEDVQVFNPDVANWYRLYRVLVGIIPIGHQSQTPWNLVGCHYSRCYDCLDSDFAFLKTRSFAEILDSDNLLHGLRGKCVEILKTEGLLSLSDSMDATRLLKAFLAAKTLCNAGTTIDFYDQYAISVDTSILQNKINSEMPLAWGNIICRYGYKRGWKGTGHKGSAFLDTMLTGDSVEDNSMSVSPDNVNKVAQMVEAQIKSLWDTPCSPSSSIAPSTRP